MDPEKLKAWLSFFSMLLWQGIIAAFLFYFRRELSSLVERIASFKFGDTEIVFQDPVESPPRTAPEAPEFTRLIDPSGFFTKDGVKQFVKTSGLVRAQESVLEVLLIFSTPRQHTWLVATNMQLFCVLDGEDTRAAGQLIQWAMPLSEAEPILVKPYKSAVTAGLLDIGTRRDWLYSKALYPDPEGLEREVRRIVKQSKKNGG